MKALVLSLALLAAPLPAFAQAPAAASAKSPDVIALEALNSEWLTAYRTRDVAALDRVLADEFEGIYPGGRITKKADMLASLSNSAAGSLDSITWEDVRVVVIGDVAVLRARSKISGKGAGGPFSNVNDYADVYVRRGGTWKAISAHVVRVAQ